jgi:bis(5'-nucleosyl)-tetraphosphatase (symmetrical)
MEFKAKGELSDAPADHLPWFEVPGRRSAADVWSLVIGQHSD